MENKNIGIIIGIVGLIIAVITIPKIAITNNQISTAIEKYIKENPTSLKDELKIIYGAIGSNGSIIEGNGFNIVHQKTGHYKLIFKKPFNKTPIFVATAYGDNKHSGTYNISISGEKPSKTNKEILIRITDGDSSNYKNNNWDFIVIGE